MNDDVTLKKEKKAFSKSKSKSKSKFKSKKSITSCFFFFKYFTPHKLDVEERGADQDSIGR